MSTLAVSDKPRSLSDSRQRLRAISRHLPERPGVYIMADVYGNVIYVGKAVNLRRRVSSYSTPSAAKDPKVAKLVPCIESLSFIETDSELEALLVESRLIKDRLPSFNRQLIQPESCCFLQLDQQEFGQIQVVPRTGRDGLHLGPFWGSSVIRDAAEAVANAFKLRRCSGPISPGGRKRACVFWEFGKCSGPCVGKVSLEEYNRSLAAAWDSLAGKSDEAVRLLVSRRDWLAEEFRFEAAYNVQRQIQALEYIASCGEDAPLTGGSFAVVVPSYLHRRPVVLMFAEGRLFDKLIASPFNYPDTDMLANRLRRLGTSKKDLLPARPSMDDLLIIRSYLRKYKLSQFSVPLNPAISVHTFAESLHESINALRGAREKERG